MESSTVLAFRIFVMLSCLIIVPMAAIFGSAFPDVVKSVLIDRLVALSTGKPPEPSPGETDPQGFREVMPAADAPPAPRWGTQAATASWQAPGARRLLRRSFPWADRRGAKDSINRPASPRRLRPVRRRGHGRAPPANGSPYVPAAATMPSGASEPTGTIVGVVSPAGCGPDRTACPLEQPDRFTEIERKLREYGATYYLLETYGSQGELYRFHCRMAVANNGQYTRLFEATDRDALKAMAEVLGASKTGAAGGFSSAIAALHGSLAGGPHPAAGLISRHFPAAIGGPFAFAPRLAIGSTKALVSRGFRTYLYLLNYLG